MARVKVQWVRERCGDIVGVCVEGSWKIMDKLWWATSRFGALLYTAAQRRANEKRGL